MEFLNRTAMLVGHDYYEKMKNKKVAVFGLGGVGGYVCEALCRSGISNFLICDNDVVSVSNINRQTIATVNTVGKNKTDVLKEKMLLINPACKIEMVNDFVMPGNIANYITNEMDYVCDAVDTVTAKIAIILCARENAVPVISSMGAGNRLDPTKVRIADIYQTANDPLARVMRRELRKRGIKKLHCVYSEELPLTPFASETELKNGKPAPGSCAFVPAAFGMALAAKIFMDLLN